MEDTHYKDELSAYLNGEVDDERKRSIEAHLTACETCRIEFDQVSLGSRLARELEPYDAPESVWANITATIDRRDATSFGILPTSTGFGLRRGLAFAVAMIAVATLATAVFLNLFSGESPYRAGSTNGNSGILNSHSVPVQSSVNTDAETKNNVTSGTNSNASTSPTSTDGFDVETLAGAPVIEGGSERISVGQLLETDARSTARIAVADIGTVDVSPNSRVRLAETSKDQHRLSLERGKLHAKIYAPPRLFVVDTPSAKAVDLGCEYTLTVDKDGDSLLHVTSGWVALEFGRRESVVPAGMMCRTRKGIGLGTPFNAEATEAFKKALDSFDFSRGGSTAVLTIVREAELYDMFTLWHLLSRVSKEDRGLIYDALAELVPPPAGVTREGILSKNKKMLDAWKAEVENAWFS